MSVAVSCTVAHYWLMTPEYKRQAGDPPGHCCVCGAEMPEEKASNANRRGYSEAKEAAKHNGLAKIAAQRPKGSVHYNKAIGRWVARIRVNGVEHHRGSYKTREEADAARVRAEEEMAR